MKARKIAIFTFITLSIFVLILSACPPIFDEEGEDTQSSKSKGKLINITETGHLTYKKWVDILIDIEKQPNYVNLDLSECTFDTDNKTGGLFELIVFEGNPPPAADPDYIEIKYIAFDPLPDFEIGKGKIVSITLPNAATMINSALSDSAAKTTSETIAIEKSAFKYFTNLDTVKALNVVRIGNYAFTGCNELKTLDFPRVGHIITDAELADKTNKLKNGFRADIGHYAFKGCTALKEITFNAAAVVGSHAFEDCTNLEKINMPRVWFLAEKSFKGCTKLVDVRFESVTKIGEESFSVCTSLKNIYFDAAPNRFGPPPYYNPDPANISYDSVIFYASVFSGCRAFEKLDIRSAWNVFFSENALDNIGTTLEIYLYDGDNAYGHPQAEVFLGEKPSVNKITLFVSKGGSNIDRGKPDNNIAYFISDNYKNSITLTITDNL